MQWLMLQQDKPEDYVIASGEMKSVREFIELSAQKLGWIKEKGGKGIIWEKSGVNEIGRRADTKEVVVRVDPRYFRPTEVDLLIGDSTKAREKLGWEPEVKLDGLVYDMMESDLKLFKKEKLLKDQGHDTYNYFE